MPRIAVAFSILCAACALLPCVLPAQSNDEPVLYVNCTQSGKAQDTGYQVTGFAMLKLCTHWQGQAGGTPSRDLYKLRRSVKGLKPGERLQFYASVMSGSGTDSQGYTADMVSTGDGATRTVVTGRDSPTQPLKTFVFEDKPSGSLPPSAYPRAEILRTAHGAVLRLSDIYGPDNGGEGYFYGVCVDNAELTGEQRTKLWTFQISEAELEDWDNLTKSESGSARGPSGQGSWNYSVTVTSRVPDLGEAAVEVEGYDRWIPEGNIDDETKAGNEIVVRAWVHKTGDRKTPGGNAVTFTFELVQYSREKGVCANWPTQPGDSGDRPDLRILREKNASLEIRTDTKAQTVQRVKEAKLVLTSFDYAAWAVLKVTAQDKDGKQLKVVYVQHEGYNDISIPRDEDKNRIADAWQEEKGVLGLPAEWDEAEVKGQSVKGDGLSLYQEYRGFVTATAGGRSHTRLEPREKAHFVIDPHGIFDESRWMAASGIRAYKVLRNWTDNRRVDVNRGFGGGQGKWAVAVELDDSKVNENQSAKALFDLRRQLAFTKASPGAKWSPRTVEFSRIYSGRIRYLLRWLRDQMLRCLQSPTTDSDRVEEAWLLTLGISREDLIAKLKGMSEAELEPLVRPMVVWAAIHEMGHACGSLEGHLGKDGDESEDCTPYVPDCPMQYMNWQDKRRLVLFGQLGGQGKFCDVEPHRCWRSLSPKE